MARNGTSWLDPAGQKKSTLSPRKPSLPLSTVRQDFLFCPVLFSPFFISREIGHFPIYLGIWPTASWSGNAFWTSQKATCTLHVIKPLRLVERCSNSDHVVWSLLTFCVLSAYTERGLWREGDTADISLPCAPLTDLPGTSWGHNSVALEAARNSPDRSHNLCPLPIAQKQKFIEKQLTYSGWNENYWHRGLLMQAGAGSGLKSFPGFFFFGGHTFSLWLSCVVCPEHGYPNECLI